MYQEISNSIKAQNYVDKYWTYTSSINGEQFSVMPDNCFDILFDLTNNRSFLSGVMTKYQVRSLGPQAQLIGIRIKAENANLFLGDFATETKNLKVNLPLVLKQFNTNTIEQLHESTTFEKQVQFLENWIQTVVRAKDNCKDQLVNHVAKAIQTSKGLIDISVHAKDNYISLRQLERRFKSHTGLTPKQYSEIVRFNVARKVIKKYPEKDLSEIAFKLGFYDPAHMTNTFTRISGQTPSNFR